MRVDKSKWEKVKFAQVGDSELGKTLNSKTDTGDLCPYLCAVNVLQGSFDLSTIKECKIEEKDKRRYLLKQGDLLVCEGGDAGRCAIWENDREMFYQNALHRVRAKDNAYNYFLMYYLQYLKKNGTIDKLSKGVTIKHFSKTALSALVLQLPPLPEQRAIAKELDGIQSMIEKGRELLEDYDRLARSIFHEMFGDPVRNDKGWEICTLNDLCQFITDGTHQTPTYTEDKENGIKFLSAKDVTSGIICWDNIKYIPFELHQELHKRLAPQRNDILLCKNGTTGICALVETDEVFDIYVSLALLRPKEGILPKYIVSAINNPVTKYQFDRSLKGIGVPNLHLKEIKKAKVPLPPLPLQQQFAARIEAIEKMKEATKAQLADLQQLFDSRMQYYFS